LEHEEFAVEEDAESCVTVFAGARAEFVVVLG
jgi:hypothetical protein